MILDLQTQTVSRLEAQEFFSAAPTITVLAEIRKDIVNEINRSLAKLGICVVVLTPNLTSRTPGKFPYPKWDRVELACQVIENVTINRGATGTGQSGTLVAEAVAYYLNNWAPEILGNALMLEGISIEEDPQFLSHTVRLFTGGVTATAPTRA